MDKLQFGVENGTLTAQGKKVRGANAGTDSLFAQRKKIDDLNDTGKVSKLTIGSVVQSRRSELGWSRKELATKVNKAESILASLESNNLPVAEAGQMLSKLETELGVKLTGKKQSDWGRRFIPKTKELMPPKQEQALRAKERAEREAKEAADLDAKPKKVRAGFQAPADFGEDKSQIPLVPLVRDGDEQPAASAPPAPAADQQSKSIVNPDDDDDE